MPGPLPDPKARRRNTPTIPTTSLPAGGRKGRPPKVPDTYELREAGERWWKWAWGLPQAAAWDVGALYTLARRASLEDDLATLDLVDHFELAEILGLDEENDIIRRLEFTVGRLKSMAGGRLSVMKEMRELDGKLGLNPEALAKLRWTIVPDEDKTPAASKAAAKKPAAVRRLRAVDPIAAAG